MSKSNLDINVKVTASVNRSTKSIRHVIFAAKKATAMIHRLNVKSNNRRRRSGKPYYRLNGYLTYLKRKRRK